MAPPRSRPRTAKLAREHHVAFAAASRVPSPVPLTNEDGATITTLVRYPELPEGCPEAAPQPPHGFRYDPTGVLRPVLQSKLSVKTPEGRTLFLHVLEVTGSPRAAMDAIGIDWSATINDLKSRDPSFAEDYQKAMDRHVQMLYAAAVQRAVHGVDKPIIGGKNKDIVVAIERTYSDQLLTLLLKRHVREFREADQRGTNVNVLQQNQQNNLRVAAAPLHKLPKAKRDQLRGLLTDAASDELDARVVATVQDEVVADSVTAAPVLDVKDKEPDDGR